MISPPHVVLDVFLLRALRLSSIAGLALSGPAWAVAVFELAAPDAYFGRWIAFPVLWLLSSVIFGLMLAMTRP